MSKSDGSTADYYELPEGATELQHLISHRNMNAQDGEIFRAIYRKGRASHSDELRDAKKVLFYAKAEVERLEKLGQQSSDAAYRKACAEALPGEVVFWADELATGLPGWDTQSLINALKSIGRRGQ